ncbi:MAG: ribosome hibernation-promoting factor, HPF/YfiA family [Desulfobacterales bacterium]
MTFKNIDPSEHLKSYAREKLDRFDKFLDNPAEANVVLAVEKFRHIAEINITGDRLNINGKEETNDMYSAIDMAMDKIETQIKKTKQKTRKRKVRLKNSVKNVPPENVHFFEDEAGQQVRIKNIEYKPMDIEEAILQMGLAENNFLVFRNARTDQVNVLYRRNDGHMGLIQPSN